LNNKTTLNAVLRTTYARLIQSIFDPLASQSDIYTAVAAPLISQFFDGYNATILAYGQTFSGKTYTMGSINTPDTATRELGIIPRVINDLFGRIADDDAWKYTTKVSFLEVYQEQVRDLLATDHAREINIREIKGCIHVSGVTEAIVRDADEMMAVLEAGAMHRSTGDTQMHLKSSRSHAIFTIVLEQAPMNADDQHAALRRSKLHLVDLAGSERLKRTGAEGVRLRESVKINSGLLALANVISILGQDRVTKTPEQHVPYRDSKLTRLLQDSLGGNSRTVMIACVSPLFEDMDGKFD
jgi:Kinesin motor domain